MVEVTLRLSEKVARTFLADTVPDVLLGLADGKELVLHFPETKDTVKKQSYAIVDGEKHITRHETGIIVEGKHVSVLLDHNDIERIRKLL